MQPTLVSAMNELFSGLYGRGCMQAQLSDRAFLQAMLDVELALMRALVHCGLAPPEAALQLAAECDAAGFDLEEIGRSTGQTGTPVPGLLSALRDRVGGAAAAHLHRGATSQDIVDTATMLVARRALAPLLDDLRRAADTCAALAERHRNALAPGRTLLQQALPLTFGLKAAGWLSGLDGAGAELADVRDHVLAVQLGGAVGTLAALGDSGLEVMADLAGQLELAQPELPWHTIRLRPARLAAALGTALGVMAKIGRDLVLLAQTEVGEVAEGGGEGRGGSSTLPHKRNPVGAVAVLACAQRGPGLVATILSAMAQEHERAAGAWQAESETLAELLRLTGSAAAALRELLDELEIDADRMRGNLHAGGALLMTESVAGALGDRIGRSAAQQLVERAARRAMNERRPLREVLLELPAVVEELGPAGLEDALAPEQYLGVADKLIDRALAAHQAAARGSATEA
jgi:3-carboxy-cis,cis-muconate cycloisomerase